ncbi:MAG: cation transporter [Deltaproteobacteria bacterium]|nr:cation transporter [Deltaproteobacteria bacterium]
MHDFHRHTEDGKRHIECLAIGERTLDPLGKLKQRRFLIAIIITAVTMILEAFGGWWTGSLALVSDAGHMLTHLFALGLSYGAVVLSMKPATEARSFGWYRAEILAALVNGFTVLFIVVWIGHEAYHRFLSPENIQSTPMFIIAIIGLVVNIATAVILKDITHDDINAKSAFIHVLSDLLSSVGVIIAAIIILSTGWTAADPIASVLIAVAIAYWALGLIKDAINVLLQSTPKGISHEDIQQTLIAGIPEICDVHHIHVWELTKNLYVMTAHIDLNDMPLSEADNIRHRAQGILHDRFHITHADLQLQCGKVQ